MTPAPAALPPMALAASAGRSAALGVLLARGWHGAQAAVADRTEGVGYCLAGGGLGLLLSSEAGQNALWAACLLAGATGCASACLAYRSTSCDNFACFMPARFGHRVNRGAMEGGCPTDRLPGCG
ncbi:unnamed protein product [Effrenium voratum]|nr:unnamed protein product [Effrenium voratum]